VPGTAAGVDAERDARVRGHKRAWMIGRQMFTSGGELGAAA